MKVIGIVPARMAASRFPGKPLYPIHGRPMLEHVFERAKLYTGWDELVMATCDDEIREFSQNKGYETILTGSHHTRALDRVAEAATKLTCKIAEDDIVVCVQGDEPMLVPEMIAAVVDPIKASPDVPATVLAVHITDEAVWLNPDTVKVAHNESGEILYTSRAPIPDAKGGFSPELMAR
ncbi:MAG: 3-deoxy-manno-octulosonate cytidylyltransferase, partial [Proteobacteria bacterium]